MQNKFPADSLEKSVAESDLFHHALGSKKATTCGDFHDGHFAAKIVSILHFVSKSFGSA